MTFSSIRRLSAIMFGLPFVLSACSGGASDPVTEPVKPPTEPSAESVASVAVSGPQTDVPSAGTLTLVATVTGSRGTVLTGRTVTWRSSDTTIATVSSAGVVTAGRVLAGTPASMTVTATVDGRTGNLSLRVLPVPAASMTLDLSDVTLATRDARAVRATVRDAGGVVLTGRAVTWTSSAPAVARADTGKGIEAVGAGTAVLTARTDSISASVRVTVVETEFYAIPTDPARIDYPWSYRTPATTASTTPPCDHAVTQLVVPRSWMGSGELPSITGAPLAPGIQRGIGHKDVWQVGNPSFANGCSGDVRQAFLRTLDRVKSIGADYITLTPWTFIIITNGVWSISHPDAVNSSIIGDADLTWAVQQAKSRGLKVHWMNQIQGGFEDGREIIPRGTIENVTKFLAAYEPYMLERAAFLQRIGVDVMQVSCVCFTFLEDAALNTVYGTRMIETVPKIRGVFRGQLRMKAHVSLTTSAPLRNAVDLVELTYWFGHQGLTDPNTPVSVLTSRYQNALQGQTGIYSTLGKPVIFELYGAPRADFLSTQYIEETFCVADFNTIFVSDKNCIQRAMKPDFAQQARLLHAQLVVASQQTALQVYGVEMGAYWMVDQLTPSSTFPHIAVSARNKPAEGVLKAWFRR